MAPQIVPAEKRYRISLLLDTYGELLTDKQRRFLQRYYEEDLSFGEIAREAGVSRQAIFDSVKHGEAALEHYEQVLRLVEKRAGGSAKMPAPPENVTVIDQAPMPERLAQTAYRLRMVGERLMLNDPETVRPELCKELELIAMELEGLAATAEHALNEPIGELAFTGTGLEVYEL